MARRLRYRLVVKKSKWISRGSQFLLKTEYQVVRSPMAWKIIESNQLSPQDIDRQGNKLLVGNGYIGYRGTLEEFTKDQKTATIVSGLYDKVGDLWREPVNLPNGCFVQVTYKGEMLHVLKTKVVEHMQTLDMQNAVHERET